MKRWKWAEGMLMNGKEVPISINLQLTDEDLMSEYVTEFLKNKYLKINETTTLKCGKCGESRTGINDLMFCNNCGTRLNAKKAIKIKSISEIYYTKFLDAARSHLREILNGRVADLDRGRVIVIPHNGKEVYVIFAEISDSGFLLRKDPDRCIIVYFDPRTKYSERLFKNRSFYIGKFLNIGEEGLTRVLNALSTAKINEFGKAEETLSSFLEKINKLSNQKKGEEFEVFVKKVLDGLKSTLPEKLEHIRITHPDDLYNSKIIRLGGAGHEDFHIINLYEYMGSIKPDKSGEAKCYESGLTLDDYGEAIRHSGLGDTLIITTTDTIPPSVWKDVIDIKRQAGYYKRVIVDRELLLILIGFLLGDGKGNSSFLGLN
jgi:hypothetical protein